MCAKDYWGALPVHYALYSGASEEVVTLLLTLHLGRRRRSYLDPSIPAVEGVNWHHLIEFLAMNNANRDRIEQAMKALIRHGWVANVRWKDLLLKLVAPTVSPTERFAYTHTLSYMADCAIYLLVNDWSVDVRIGIKKWRDGIINQPILFKSNTYGQPEVGTEALLEAMFRQVGEYEARCNKLASQLYVLELAVWKAKMDTSTFGTDRMRRRCKKRSRDDEATFGDRERAALPDGGRGARVRAGRLRLCRLEGPGGPGRRFASFSVEVYNCGIFNRVKQLR